MNLYYEVLLTLFGISAFILLCCFFTKYSNIMITLKNHKRTKNKNRIVPIWTISPQVLNINDNNEKQDITTVSTIIEFPYKNRLHEVALVTI
jgi:hypothetical protein